MNDRIVAALPREAQPFLQSELPEWLDVRWYSGGAEARTAGVDATIGWFDGLSSDDFAGALSSATRLKWLFSRLAGVDGLPLGDLARRGIICTNSPGISAPTVSEYVMLGMLSIAKGYREIVSAQARHEWLADPPGRIEVMGSSALVLGYGAVGQMIETRLNAFGVAVTVVRRTPDPGGHALGPDQWRARLQEFDWVILALPATPDTSRMIGASELAAMKPTAVLVNVARGALVDQEALVEALRTRRIAAAFLDVTEPEPLPPDHPLWSLENVHITMHLAGRSQMNALRRTCDRLLENLTRYRAGEPLRWQVDLTLGY